MKESTRILIVEDEAVVALELEDRLTQLGFEVIAAVATGEQAVKEALARKPDLILMDIMLQGNMDGIQASEAIRESLDIPVLYLTAYSDNETLTRARVTKPYAYLLKPFTGRELLTNIEIALYRHQMEKQLKQSEARFRAFIEGTNDLVQSIRADGSIEFVNNSWLLTLGYSEDEAMQLRTSDYVHGDSIGKLTECIDDVLQGKALPQVELILLTKSGRKLYVEGNLFPRTEADGSIAIQAFHRNITERREAQEAQKNAADTAMLYIDLMGHDLRQSLQAITTGIEIIDAEVGLEEVSSMKDLIFDALSTAEGLIRKVQTTRGLLYSPLVEIDLNEVVETESERFRREFRDVTIHLDLRAKSARIHADEHLRFVISNMLENAVTFADGLRKEVWISLIEENKGYELAVSDNGPGIPDQRKESLLDPQRRFGGIGIHQSIRIISKYGGFMTVEDRVRDAYKEGARFRVWLPRMTST